jgi:DNA-binding MarR family transcriptional regulator
MSKTVELVSEWVDFESHHPHCSIEDFCRHILAGKQLSTPWVYNAAGGIDYPSIYALTRTINRLSRLWMYFTLLAIKPLGLTSFDEFAFLYTINKAAAIRKKDVIYSNLIEISSGLLVIERLLKKGLVIEIIDEVDKRAKILSLSKKGKKTLESCHMALRKVAEDLYGKMPGEEMGFCIDYLSILEKSIAQRWYRLKKFEPVE